MVPSSCLLRSVGNSKSGARCQPEGTSIIRPYRLIVMEWVGGYKTGGGDITRCFTSTKQWGLGGCVCFLALLKGGHTKV